MLTSRGNEDARARRAKIEADALALLSSLNSRGRLTPLLAGTLVQERYRVERYVRGSDLRNLYRVTWDDALAHRYCWECGFAENPPDAEQCTECRSDLGGRTFSLTERWKTDFQLYHDFCDLGLCHPNLSRVYEAFEERQRLFLVSEPLDGQFLADLSSPMRPDEVVSIGMQACELLQYLHEQGVSLASFGREHLVFQDGVLMLHDPDLGALHEGPTPQNDRAMHMDRLGRILRECVPADMPELCALMYEVIDHTIHEPEELHRRLEQLSIDLPTLKQSSCEAAMSDVGMHRTLNEDNWGWDRINDQITIYAVADGMGGHDGGEIASELAIRTFLAGVRRRITGRTDLTDDVVENLLDESFREANNTIKGFSDKRRSDMGTTMVGLLVIRHQKAYVVNVGDSRAYLLRNNALKQLSLDHSLVANLVAMGKITKAAAKNHPHSNILIRTVGKEWDVDVDIFDHDLRSGDVFLLCSDGLWGEVDDAELVDVMRSYPDLRVACQELVRTANRHGGHDNVTALVVRVP